MDLALDHVLAIVCGHVFRAERLVRLVIHHADGSWQFVCGEHDHPLDCSDFEPVGVDHLVERQTDLADLPQLLTGTLAERVCERGSEIWRVQQLLDDD